MNQQSDQSGLLIRFGIKALKSLKDSVQSLSKEFFPGSENVRLKCSPAANVSVLRRNSSLTSFAWNLGKTILTYSVHFKTQIHELSKARRVNI